MQIPYTVEPRPDTGLYNAKLGVWLFLASEVMLFGALFSALILLRTGATSWPHGYEVLNVPLATINTMVLITSSVSMVMSWAALRLGDFGKYRKWMGLTFLLGLVFMVIKTIEYAAKFEHHLYPSHDNFMATYFTLTGLHGLARAGRHDRHRLSARARQQDVEDRAGEIHQSSRGGRAVLAFRGSGLDLSFPHPIPAVVARRSRR